MKYIPVLCKLQMDIGKEMQGLCKKEEKNVFWSWMACLVGEKHIIAHCVDV